MNSIIDFCHRLPDFVTHTCNPPNLHTSAVFSACSKYGVGVGLVVGGGEGIMASITGQWQGLMKPSFVCLMAPGPHLSPRTAPRTNPPCSPCQGLTRPSLSPSLTSLGVRVTSLTLLSTFFVLVVLCVCVCHSMCGKKKYK